MQSEDHTSLSHCICGTKKTCKQSCSEERGYYGSRYIHKGYKKRENRGWKGWKDFRMSKSGRVEKGKYKDNCL